jgi:DNA polymerase-4
VGPKTAERLRLGGLRTVADVAAVPVPALAALVGEDGAAHLHELAHGRDDRPVVPDRDAKSISEERTYGEDLTDPDAIDRVLLARSEGVARTLRRDGLVARTVHLKVRAGDFTTWTRAATLSHPTDLADVILREARRLLRERIDLGDRGVRLLGVGVSGLERPGTSPAPLFEDAEESRLRRLAVAEDALKDRLGEDAVTRARLLRRGSGEASSLPTVD